MGRLSVNGREIPLSEVAREAAIIAPGKPMAQAMAEARRALAIRALLLDEADRLGVEAKPVALGEKARETDEEARLRELIEREVTVPRADEVTCRRYFEAHRDRFKSPGFVDLAHILLAADPADKPRYAERVEEAVRLIERLSGAPEEFAALAAGMSDCPSAGQGGDLGRIGPGQTVEEFEKAVFAIKEPGLSRQPVCSRYGVHVVRLDRRIEGRPLAFEEVHAHVAAYLEEAAWRRAVAQYIAILAGRARIEGVRLGGPEGPLVQ